MSYVLFVDILFVFLFLGFVFVGARRGFFTGFVRSFGWVLSLLASYAFGGAVSDWCDRLFVRQWIGSRVFTTVENAFSEQMGRMDAETLLSRFPFPFLKNSLFDRVEALLSKETGARLLERLTELISAPLSEILSRFLGYGITFVLALVLLRVFAKVFTSLAEKVEPLCALNRFFGGVWGALAGSVFLLALSALIKLFLRSTAIYTESTVVRVFCDSAFLSFLN